METILKNFNDPSWWFTGIFFVLVALVMPLLFTRLRSAAVTAHKSRRIRELRAVKRLRWDYVQVSILIVRSGADYVIFVILAFAFLSVLLLTPISKSYVLTALASIPIYMFEIRWLTARSLIQRVVKSRRRIPRFESPKTV